MSVVKLKLPERAKKIQITPECEERFVSFLYRKLGLVIQDHQLRSMRDTIEQGSHLFGYRECEAYLKALEFCSTSSPEMEQLIAGVTIGESYFFRDHKQINYLRDNWLPELINRRRKEGNRSIRIWSAGCSNGQELYTVAMLLAEQIPDLEAWNIHLLGTDINADVLSNAVHGHYTEWSFRAMTDAMRERHFSSQNRGHVIHSALRRMAHFTYLNLADDDYPSILTQTNALDLILCRNVFIYFDRPVIERVMQKFTRSLMPGGMVMLGASDLMVSSSADLALKQKGEIFYYHKSREQESGSTHVTPKRPRQISTIPKAVKARPKKIGKSTPPEHKPTNLSGTAQIDQQLQAMLHESRWNEALLEIRRLVKQQGATALLLQHEAKVMANLGELEEASRLCNESLKLDSLDKHAHFLRGMILTEMGQKGDAEQSFRKTIYLDSQFAEAHFQLGTLLFRQEKGDVGLKFLKNALQLSQQADPEAELHHAAGMTFQRFAEILENEMEIYAGSGQVNDYVT
ncbi:MAG: CheR family methyltransferase [Mariprofundaceae bacterium]